MKDIIEKLKKYNDKTGLNSRIEIFDDESGSIEDYDIGRLFEFNNIDELNLFFDFNLR